MATHTEWLNSPANVMFAWAEYQPGADPTGQLRLLLKEEKTKEPDSNNSSVFVVASELERRLLITRMQNDEGEMLPNSACVAIYSHESLLETLRSTDCEFWQKQSVKFFYQFDMYFSAASCLAIMQIMYAVRTKSFRARCRCLIMVPFPEVLKPLFEALDLICPYQEKFTQVTIPQQDFEVQSPIGRIPSSEFVDRVIAGAVRAIMRRKLVIVFCTKDTAHEILSALPQDLPDYDFLWNDVAHVDLIAKKCSPAGNQEEAAILFMTESNHVPLYFEYACDIFIEGRKDTPSWDRSRIVHSKQTLTRHELICMLSYGGQCQQSTEITTTDRTVVEAIQTRLVDHAQSWGFLADLALHFTDIDVPYLAMCFMRKPTVLETVMTHFAVMGFLKGKPGEFIRPFTVCEDAEKMRKLLVVMDHDFHLAWFVCVGMRLSGVSVTARCAVLRIGAFAKCNFGVVQKPYFAQNFFSGAQYIKMVDALVKKLDGHASMPRHLYAQGFPWITLMIWQLAQGLDPSIRTGELQSRVEALPDVPMCNLDLVQCAHVSNIVSALDSLYAVESATQTLHLTDADCENIQRAMVATLLHKAIMVELDSGKFKHKDVVVAQLALDRLTPGLGEILLPGCVLGTPGTTKNVAFFAALHVQAEDNGERYYTNSVALPMRFLGSWRSPGGETFLRCAAYHGPDDP